MRTQITAAMGIRMDIPGKPPGSELAKTFICPRAVKSGRMPPMGWELLGGMSK